MKEEGTPGGGDNSYLEMLFCWSCRELSNTLEIVRLLFVLRVSFPGFFKALRAAKICFNCYKIKNPLRLFRI